ncbi:hypothetical protein L6R50_22855 [Myxococcota bacterium]|nr:hypothetical protein [Myxococcota bacterium]
MRGMKFALPSLIAALALGLAACTPSPRGNGRDDDDDGGSDDDSWIGDDDTGDDDTGDDDTGDDDTGDDDTGDDDTGDDDTGDDDTGDDDTGDDDTGPPVPDADGDGISDEDEGDGDPDLDTVPNDHDTDSDGDGIGDSIEAGDSDLLTAPVDTDGDGDPDFLDLDSDADGHLDAVEGSDDVDGDGVRDFRDLDSDDDSLPDATDPGPWIRDADGDGYTDLAEVAWGTSPTSSGSKPPSDVIYRDLAPGASSTVNVEAAVPGGGLLDVAMLVDTTCSGASYISGLKSALSSIVGSMAAEYPAAAFAVASHADYYYGSFGNSGDLPFFLKQQMTTDASAVTSKISALASVGGGDTDDAGVEAMYQLLTGRGFDQDCDDALDTSSDVKPFVAHGGDAFGGAVAGAYVSTVVGTGPGGGAGFRDGATPVVIWASDGSVRDPDSGDAVPPPCDDSEAAGSSDVIAAALAAGATVIGIETDTLSLDFSPTARLVAEGAGSVGDLDGDGAADDPYVFTGTGSTTISGVLAILDALAGEAGPVDVTLEVDGAASGLVSGVSPGLWPSVDPGDTVDFDVTLTSPGALASPVDQVFVFSLRVYADGTRLVTERAVLLVLRGT